MAGMFAVRECTVKILETEKSQSLVEPTWSTKMSFIFVISMVKKLTSWELQRLQLAPIRPKLRFTSQTCRTPNNIGPLAGFSFWTQMTQVTRIQNQWRLIGVRALIRVELSFDRQGWSLMPTGGSISQETLSMIRDATHLTVQRLITRPNTPFLPMNSKLTPLPTFMSSRMLLGALRLSHIKTSALETWIYLLAGPMIGAMSLRMAILARASPLRSPSLTGMDPLLAVSSLTQELTRLRKAITRISTQWNSRTWRLKSGSTERLDLPMRPTTNARYTFGAFKLMIIMMWTPMAMLEWSN